MWQSVGVGGRVWGHVAGVEVCHMGLALVHRQRHVAGVGTCGRVWGYVAGCGSMWQGWWQGVGACGRGGHVMGSGLWQRWGHVAGCGGMWHGVGAGGWGGSRVWGHVAGVGVCGRGSGLWHRRRYVVGWGHVAGCGSM